jgi:hypothetical protein
MIIKSGKEGAEALGNAVEQWEKNAGEALAAADEASANTANSALATKMSAQLYEFAKRLAAGGVSAEEFADPFIERWKQERDASSSLGDLDDMSERMSSIFCMADLYNPVADRKEYELDGDGLRSAVSEILCGRSNPVQTVRSGNSGAR